MTDLELQLLNALLDAYDVLLKWGLIVLELSDLLLQTAALGPLVSIVTLDLLLNTVQLIGEGLARVLLFHGKDALKGLLLWAEDLNFLLMGV